jgi:hypothetical protein
MCASNRHRGLSQAADGPPLVRGNWSAWGVCARARSDSSKPADVLSDCPEVDTSAWLGHSPDIDRSDRVTS